MKKNSSKIFLKSCAIILCIAIVLPSFSLLGGINTLAESNSSLPIVVVDFENNVVANSGSNIVGGRPSTLSQTGSLNTNEFYSPGNERRKTGGNYWARSSWALVTSDANPKYTDTYYDWANNNEYMKLTYVYQPLDMSNIERSETTHTNYTKAAKPSWYKDYAYNPGFLLPELTDTYNYKSGDVKSFSGEVGKEYRITIDVALVEDDDKKVELYAMPIASDGSVILNDFSKAMPSESKGDILICSTEATGDKKLEVQSKTGYTFKTYEFIYTASSGKTPFIVMVTNDGQTINAGQGHNFACAYVDNIKIYDDFKYLTTAKPDGTACSIKYTEGTKLKDIAFDIDGYTNDGRWYEDSACTIATTDVYPVANKVYYRKWKGPIVVVDFENNVVANSGSNIVDGRPSTLLQTGSLNTNEFYAPGNSNKKTGGNYWARSSWALVTSDANPKYTDTYYDWANNNEYMKLTYVYQPLDMSNIERSQTTHSNYTKAGKPSQYKDYAFNPGFLLPELTDTYNYKSGDVKSFSGEVGKEYRIVVDVALIEDDDKKVELYVMSIASDGSKSLEDFTNIMPSEAKGDILICSTEATGDKKLEVQSKTDYTFKTYEFIYTASSGKTPFIVMVTNDGQTINAEQGHNFACAYVDNIKIYDEYLYFESAMPDNTLLNVKYTEGTKLADIETSIKGYKHDGKWYEDFDCTTVSDDEYPIANKKYYRKWTKYFTLDFDSDYYSTGSASAFYKDPISDRYVNGTGQYWAWSSFFALRNNKILMTYWNYNPTNVRYEFYDKNYAYSPVIKIFDPSETTTFTGSPNFEYKISFDYEVSGPIPKEDISVYLYLTPNGDVNAYYETSPSKTTSIVVGKFDVNIADGAKGRTPELTFTAKMGYTPQIVMVTNDGVQLTQHPSEYHTFYIDNLTLEEVYPDGQSLLAVNFDSNGGSDVGGFRVIKGDSIGELPLPTRNGYLFDYWYDANDPEQKEINTSYIPASYITLKAKWITIVATNYNSSFDNFDVLRYPNVLDNYENLDTVGLYNTGVADSTMTAANRYIKEGCPSRMDAALLISNSPAAMSNSKFGIAASALLNSDGTKFAVKSGVKYKIEFDYLPLGEGNAHSYIKMVYGSYTADTINLSTAVGIEMVAVHGIDTESKTATQYFKATQDGFVFFTLGARQNFDNTDNEHFVLIDNVKITVESDVKSITFKDADTDSKVSTRPIGFSYATQYGMPGDKIREFGINVQDGRQIEGFYNDRECTIPCTDYDIITDKDRTVYVKYRNVDYSTLSDFSKPITLDFETSSDFDLEIMYRYLPYMSWTSTEVDNIVDYVGNDSKNASSGSGYVRIKDYEFAYGTSGHSFVLYDKNNPSGIMIFSPNTSYRISAQAKYEDDAKVPALKVWFVDPTTLTYSRNRDANVSTTMDDAMGYTEISTVITTGDKPVAVAIGGVYLAEQNVYIDDVKVEKLVERTIKFETNGGDAVDTITVLPYYDLTSYDPGFAFKPGYEFVGWYLDKELTKPFEFADNYITDSIVLYAKYIKEDIEYDDSDDFMDDYYDDWFDDEEIIDDAPEFGEQLIINAGNPAGKTDGVRKIIQEKNSELNIWFILVVSLSVLAVLGLGGFFLVWIARRKKKV